MESKKDTGFAGEKGCNSKRQTNCRSRKVRHVVPLDYGTVYPLGTFIVFVSKVVNVSHGKASRSVPVWFYDVNARTVIPMECAPVIRH